MATISKTRQAFWEEKFRRNVERDKCYQRDLKKDGWKVIVLWECHVMLDPFAAVEKVLKTIRPVSRTLDYDALPDKRSIMKAAEARLHRRLAH